MSRIAAFSPRDLRHALLTLISADLAADGARGFLGSDQTELRHTFFVGRRQLGYRADISTGRPRAIAIEALPGADMVSACNAADAADRAALAARPLGERLADYKLYKMLTRR